jgi:hypothetical protein
MAGFFWNPNPKRDRGAQNPLACARGSDSFHTLSIGYTRTEDVRDPAVL